MSAALRWAANGESRFLAVRARILLDKYLVAIGNLDLGLLERHWDPRSRLVLLEHLDLL